MTLRKDKAFLIGGPRTWFRKGLPRLDPACVSCSLSLLETHVLFKVSTGHKVELGTQRPTLDTTLVRQHPLTCAWRVKMHAIQGILDSVSS